MTARQQAAIRKRLRNKLGELDVGCHSAPLRAERLADPLEEAQQQVFPAPALSVINTEWEIREAVGEALARPAIGECGICEDCGETIGAKRLEAVPWALRCVPCQREWEELAAAFPKVA